MKCDNIGVVISMVTGLEKMFICYDFIKGRYAAGGRNQGTKNYTIIKGVGV